MAAIHSLHTNQDDLHHVFFCGGGRQAYPGLSKEPSPRPMLAVLQYDPSQSNSWTYLAGTPPYANYYSQYVFLASMPNDSLVAMYEDTGSIGVLDGSETWRSVLTAGFPSESDATLFALEGDGNSAPIAVLAPRSGSTPWL